MPTNENTYNSRVTSESLEAKFRQVFPSQGGSELISDLYASGVIQPVIDFSSVAEGSVLSEDLQTAWDFSTGSTDTAGASSTLVTTPGFWKISSQVTLATIVSTQVEASIYINDGTSTKIIFKFLEFGSTPDFFINTSWEGVVFLRSGDSLKQITNQSSCSISTRYRQIADVNGNLVNPLGFTFS